jgi:hypothetical protein
MWPFDRGKKRSKENIRRAFSQYLSRDVLDALAENPESLRLPEPQAVKLFYIVLQVRDDAIEDVPAYLDRALEIGLAFNCTTYIVSSMVVITFGLPIDIMNGRYEEGIDRRADVVARLLGELGPNIRIISGCADGLLGMMGTKQRLTFGPVIPNFGDHLRVLTRLDYGQSEEI